MPLRLSVALILAALLCSPSSASKPAGPADLLGHWHIVGGADDALFLLVRGVGIDLKANGSFEATARYLDGSEKTKSGTWSAKGNEIHFAIAELGAHETASYHFEGKDLVFHDAAFHLTLRVRRGPLPPANKEGSWF